MNSRDDIQDWNRIASRYAESVEDNGDRCYADLKPVFWNLLGDVRGFSVLDLGCGQGWLSGELIRRGAIVHGIDGSDALVARARELFPDGCFSVYDLAAGLPRIDETFDLVVSHMVVMDIPTIDRLFHDVGLSLKPGGRFVLTFPHPCFFSHKSQPDADGAWFKKVTGYLRERNWRIDSFGGHTHYHRSLEFYITRLVQAGLAVTRLHEPPHQAQSPRVPVDFARDFPVFIWIEAGKQSKPPAFDAASSQTKHVTTP